MSGTSNASARWMWGAGAKGVATTFVMPQEKSDARKMELTGDCNVMETPRLPWKSWVM